MSARSPRHAASLNAPDAEVGVPPVDAKQDSREIEDRYGTIVQMASEGIWAIDSEHRTTFANRALVGWSERRSPWGSTLPT